MDKQRIKYKYDVVVTKHADEATNIASYCWQKPKKSAAEKELSLDDLLITQHEQQTNNNNGEDVNESGVPAVMLEYVTVTTLNVLASTPTFSTRAISIATNQRLTEKTRSWSSNALFAKRESKMKNTNNTKKKKKKKKTKKKKKKTKRSSSGIPRRKNSPTDVNSNDANDADDNTNRQISFVRRALVVARGPRLPSFY